MNHQWTSPASRSQAPAVLRVVDGPWDQLIPTLGSLIRCFSLMATLRFSTDSDLFCWGIVSHRIHGAGIYANIKGVYWWDPCYHIIIYIYSSTMDPMGLGRLNLLDFFGSLCPWILSILVEVWSTLLRRCHRQVIADHNEHRLTKSKKHGEVRSWNMHTKFNYKLYCRSHWLYK